MLSIHNSVRLDWTVWEAIVSNVLSWCLMDRQYDSIHVTCEVFFHLTVFLLPGDGAAGGEGYQQCYRPT